MSRAAEVGAQVDSFSQEKVFGGVCGGTALP